MLIQVIYQSENRFGAVHKFRLESLINSGQLFAFRRAKEWVLIENGPVRGAGGHYSGPERRNSALCYEYSQLGAGEKVGQVLPAELEWELLELECMKILKSYS
ncbi:MAG: GSU3473 family protein [Geobacteraceae bacterium]